MIKAIIFDMDGVLVDTEPVHCASYVQTFQDHGVKIEDNHFYDHWTKKGGNLQQFVDQKGLNVDIDLLRSQKRTKYQDQLKESLPIIAGSKEVVQSLSLIYPLALATSSYAKEASLILELMEIKSNFKTIVTCEDVKNIKPDPECFLLASKRLGIDPKNALVIEDAQKGVIAAKRAGMRVIAIPNQYTFDHDFSLADRIIASINELTPQLIESLQNSVLARDICH